MRLTRELIAQVSQAIVEFIVCQMPKDRIEYLPCPIPTNVDVRTEVIVNTSIFPRWLSIKTARVKYALLMLRRRAEGIKERQPYPP
jgi:hypothetical protein